MAASASQLWLSSFVLNDSSKCKLYLLQQQVMSCQQILHI